MSKRIETRSVIADRGAVLTRSWCAPRVKMPKEDTGCHLSRLITFSGSASNDAINAFSRQRGLSRCGGHLDQRHAAMTNTLPSPWAFELIGVDRTTISRWPAFWRDHVPEKPFS